MAGLVGNGPISFEREDEFDDRPQKKGRRRLQYKGEKPDQEGPEPSDLDIDDLDRRIQAFRDGFPEIELADE